MLSCRIPGFLTPVLLVSLLTACQLTGGHVGAVATGHFTALHQFPVLLVAWCGEAAPQQIDLVGERQRRHLVATREFDGNQLEVDLAAPGDDWRITDGDGGPVYRMGPESPEEEYLVGIGSEAAEPGGSTEHDIGTVTFTTEVLGSEEGVYADTGGPSGAGFLPVEDFPPDC